MSAPFRFHREDAIDLAASPELVFDVLNDHDRLVAHMGKPSLMMAGGVIEDTDWAEVVDQLNAALRFPGSKPV